MVTIPLHLKKRPVHNGFVVPWFVMWWQGEAAVDEKTKGAVPDFRTVDTGRHIAARKYGFCWLCGTKLGQHKTFVFGPVAAVVNASYEPPSHRDCARYAVQVCPFMLGRTDGMRDATTRKGMTLLPVATHTPDMMVLLTTASWTFELFDRPRGIGRFQPGPPLSIEHWAGGKPMKDRAQIARIYADAVARAFPRPSEAAAREHAWRVNELLKLST